MDLSGFMHAFTVVLVLESGYDEILRMIEARILTGQRSRSPDLCCVILSCFVSHF